jgi:hypothetical protein
MLCKYILKETLDRKGNFYNGALWVHCSQKLETFCNKACLVKCCCLRFLLSFLGWSHMLLPSLDSFLMTPSKQVMTRNLKLDVILLVYKVNVILLVFICDENVFVMTPCGGCQILAGSRIQPVI